MCAQNFNHEFKEAPHQVSRTKLNTVEPVVLQTSVDYIKQQQQQQQQQQQTIRYFLIIKQTIESQINPKPQPIHSK